MDLCSASYGTAGAKWLRQSFFCFYGYIGGEQHLRVTQTAETTQEEQTELVKTGSMELQYAENFTVDYYEDGYKMLTTLPDSQTVSVSAGGTAGATGTG